jgi:alkanesulfonate monooxygenase SsuD/methylene tetrahydromethanopterin reductase-like flavin-dependent oxidoreductase (luciferase family)
MKVSLFTEVIIPRPWDDDSEYDKLQESLQQVELADQHGFHAVWVVEHHFLEEYAHSSAPEVFLAAASQRTRNIRLGHGIMNLLPPINHPLRAAERISTLDLLSGGRVEFGSGEGSSVSEIDGFNVDPGVKKEMWEESLQVCVDAMTQTPFPGISGKFLNIPPRNVVPKPRQKPHPPLWMATTRRERIREAARKGLGALCFYWVEPEASKEWVDEYYKVFEDECVPVGLFANPTVAMTSWTMCAETAGEAALRAIEGIDFHRFSSVHYYQKGPHRPGITDVWGLFESSGEAEKSRQRARDIATGVSARPGTAVGTA